MATYKLLVLNNIKFRLSSIPTHSIVPVTIALFLQQSGNGVLSLYNVLSRFMKLIKEFGTGPIYKAYEAGAAISKYINRDSQLKFIKSALASTLILYFGLVISAMIAVEINLWQSLFTNEFTTLIIYLYPYIAVNCFVQSEAPWIMRFCSYKFILLVNVLYSAFLFILLMYIEFSQPVLGVFLILTTQDFLLYLTFKNENSRRTVTN